MQRDLYPYGRIKNNGIRSNFTSMVKRCYSPLHKGYPTYGGRGIKVCDAWMKHPESFEEWAINNNWSKGMTVDRIDPDKGYCPDNCKLATLSENSKWKKGTFYITVNGITESGRGWDRILGLSPCKINNIIRLHGMDSAINFIKDKLREKESA